MAGAKQWSLPCEHLSEMTAERTMHSEVSNANADKWADEQRTPRQGGEGKQHRVGQKRLKRLLKHYDGRVLVCNSCRRIKILDDGELTVVHSGDPYYSNRVGDWQIDIAELKDDSNGLRGLD